MAFSDGYFLAALKEYQYRYWDRRQPYRRVFETVSPNLRETGTLLPQARVDRG
jgi:hypothetical protein